MSTNISTYFELLVNFDTVMVTPNRRLSATLHKQYQGYQKTKQNQAWATPNIMPLISWVESLWREYTTESIELHPLLLNNAQAQYLWQNILSTTARKPLLRINEAAEHIKSAWVLLNQWQVDVHQPIFNMTEEYKALYDWVLQYRALCREKKYIDHAVLPDLITAKIKNGTIAPAKTIILVGFNEHAPQLRSLLDACRQNDSEILTVELNNQNAHCHRVSFPERENEIIAMAHWAKNKLDKNKDSTIGCVIPSLDKIRDRVLQIFCEAFANPNTLAPSQTTCPFNISAGKSLSHFPVIHAGLHFLQLSKKNISRQWFSYALFSPFIGASETEKIKRANFDKLLRQRNIQHIDWDTLLSENNNEALPLQKNLPLLAQHFKSALDFLQKQPEKQSYTEWATAFNEFLTILGWPGERSLNSEEYQTVEAWLRLFNEFSTLDHIGGPPHLQHALHTLQTMTQSLTFQPETPEAPIQVLGLLEAAALPFDYLWVAGMDDLSWPPQPNPNPFIPKQLQRELSMPHATAERELAYCQHLTQQFQRSASFVIFSHALSDADIELNASPLIRHLSEDLEVNADPDAISKQIYKCKAIERINDEKGPLVSSDEKIRGGINVIKQQALCPFKAFAEWRLHAQELESSAPGLRGKDRGSLVHKTLEFLWDELKEHATLISLTEDNLHQLIKTAIDKAIAASALSHATNHKYINLEKTRMEHIIQDWLSIEKKRAPFKVIGKEKTMQLKLNQLDLSLRIDRIDELDSGAHLIIDYKTGKNNNINDWLSERPSEPQLPLYSMVDPDRTIGIAFAQIAAGEHSFKGISQQDLDIKGIKLISDVQDEITWKDQLTKWNNTFLQLSNDFCSGMAKVDPKDPTKTCNWCAIKPICRIYEKNITDDDCM